MFAGRKLLIATKHNKEHVIAPLLEHALGVQCITANNFDSDTLGTFTGEVERTDDPITTAKQKCLLALETNPYDLVLASEGSFGPHPAIFFAAADDEFLFFMDTKNDLEIVVRHLSIETNFNGAEVSTEKDLLAFAEAALFPSHALVLRKSKTSTEGIVKGITDQSVLIDSFYKVLKQYGTAFVETDMRALFNPTRMKVIEGAAEKLVEKINSVCPVCKMPGFGITDSQPGLPCEVCNFPTRSILSHVYCCKKCAFTTTKKYPNGKQNEEPMYCDVCNP